MNIVLFLFLNIFMLIKIELCTANYTFTFQMAAQCKEFTSQHGYKYETFFSTNDLTNTKLKSGLQFEMHLAILAARDGHVLLSSVANPTPEDSVYEIVFGGGNNRFTELRRNLRSNSKSTVLTPDLLSPIHYRAFFITVDDDGLIQIGREGENLAIITYNDPDPIFVKYFSFTSWKGVEAKFLYDCPVASVNETGFDPCQATGNEVNTTQPSRPIERNLPASERLKRSLMLSRPYNVPPSHRTTVKIQVVIISVSYNAFKTLLTSSLVIFLKWNDPGLAWNPDKFNGTKSLKFRPGQIWKPSLIETGAIDGGPIDSRSHYPILVNYDGSSEYLFETQLNSWCTTQETTRWPHEELTCQITFESWHTHDDIKLESNSGLEQLISKMLFSKETLVTSEWKIAGHQAVLDKYQFDNVVKAVLELDDIYNDYTTHQSDKFILVIDLTRKATTYYIVFYVPLAVLMLFFLMSFWTKPLTLERVWLYMGIIICICVGLSYIDYLVPINTLPSILIVYTFVLASALIALLIQIAMIYGLTERVCQSRLVQNLLTLKTFRMIFCLPEKKISKKYSRMTESIVTDVDDPEISSMQCLEQMENDTEPYAFEDKDEIAMVFDKILTVLFSLEFAIILALHS